MCSDMGLPHVSSLMNGWSQMAMRFGSTGWETHPRSFTPMYCVSYRERGRHEDSFSALPKTRCWSIYQIKSTHPRACTLIPSISGLVYCSTMLGDESRAPKRQTVNASRWRVPGNLINHRAQNEMFCPLSSLSTSPAPLFWGILFYLGWEGYE